MNIHIKYTIFIYIFLAFLYLSNGKFLGPAKITLKRMEKCGEDAEGVKIDFAVRKFNRTHDGVDVFVTTPYEFGPEIQFNGTAAKWGDGGWKPHVLDMYEVDACMFFIKYAKPKFFDVLRLNNLPERCPVPKGSYGVKNYIFDGVIDVPVMYGDFRVDMILSRNGVMQTCARLFIKSDPKTQSMGK